MIGKTFRRSQHRMPETYHGRGSLSVIGSVEAQDPVLLLSSAVSKLDAVQRVVSKLGVQPTLVTACDAKTVQDIASKHPDADSVIGIGGGTVLDCAKLVREHLCQGKWDPEQLGSGSREVSLLLAPSTPATGSETSRVAVLADPKRPLVHDSLIADVAVLDPVLLESLPERLLLLSAADILAHGYEAHVSRLADERIQSFCASALSQLSRFATASDAKQRLEAILVAGNLAGYAQSNAFVGVAHALAHVLEQEHGISHAEAITAVIQRVITYQSDQGIVVDGIQQVLEQLDLPDVAIPSLDDDAIERVLSDPSMKTSPLRYDAKMIQELLS